MSRKALPWEEVGAKWMVDRSHNEVLPTTDHVSLQITTLTLIDNSQLSLPEWPAIKRIIQQSYAVYNSTTSILPDDSSAQRSDKTITAMPYSKKGRLRRTKAARDMLAIVFIFLRGFFIFSSHAICYNNFYYTF